MPTRKHQKKPSRSHRSTLSLQKTEILINIYDLLPPGRITSLLWHMGTSLLHSGVVINGKEYAYGGHDRRGLTGVYWTKPRTEPPGGTFRCEYLHGFTLAPQNEIDAIIREASDEFQGTGYNLLTRNCNHFTSYLCRRLTGQPAPGFLNRAASIGVALPCVVPKEWIEVPDFETADGALLDEDEEAGHESERARMLRSSDEQPRLVGQEERDAAAESEWDSEEERRQGGSGKGKGKAPVKDAAGRVLPPAERAPVA
ncbi:hypothetical protein NEMBOFW57_002630 [Staphylotrichum longicolle]|uniref:PPPDE domain-containing protein n=1 Tax=Staphylotrichum longicolle TaxID=669026 RepID=A0AAD4F4M8_9PEZI|nr:hypothetical protein NEMBOFW57_002630 [Staphylotrichum longicolle]